MKDVIRILCCSFLFFYAKAEQPADSPYLSSETVEHWIIIHGTFARALAWYKKGGAGYEALVEALSARGTNARVYSFLWSSYNNQPARVKAAQELLTFLEPLFKNRFHTIHLVAHSHGGTVALLAAHMLSEQQKPFKIKELFNLGTPVHAAWYPQACSAIDTVYHLYSYGDMVQPVITMFERTLPEAPNVYNLSVKKDFDYPVHGTLRSAEFIGQLPMLHTLIKAPGTYCLHLNTKSKAAPFFTLSADLDREKDLASDQAVIRQILTLYADTRKKRV